MRVRPRWPIGLAVILAYMAVVAVIWVIVDFDYVAVGESVENLRSGVVIPVGVGAVFLAVITTYLGWWKNVLREIPRTAPRWTLAVPVLMFAMALGNIVSADFSRLSGAYVLTLALGTALVGFSEEILARGLALVGFRGSVSEGWAWFYTSLLFGLLHGLNLFFGQGLGATVQQIGFAFLFGSALYVVRMSTGFLVVGMVIHAMWDFGVFAGDQSDSTNPIVGLANYPFIIITLIAVWRVIKAKNAAESQSPTQTVAA